jgi:copper chaperone CopZ
MFEFTIQSISCSHCVRAVTDAVRSVDPQAQVDVDVASKSVRIETTSGRDAVAGALTQAGYPPN